MTSSKDIYESDVYAANIYAAGIWRGIGVAVVSTGAPRVFRVKDRAGRFVAEDRRGTFDVKDRTGEFSGDA